MQLWYWFVGNVLQLTIAQINTVFGLAMLLI